MTEVPTLSVRDLTVYYGSRRAVAELSLELVPGQIVALLGPNGAGKSTALTAIAGAIRAAQGRIEVAGFDIDSQPLEARARIGFADQPPSLYEFYSVREHLQFIAASRGKSGTEEAEHLLEVLGLPGIADRLCRELSFGMRQRVSLASALIGEPPLVLLDETLNGLDPHAARRAREVVSGHAERGAAILLSTHLLEVAERLSQRILIVDSGRLRVDIGGNELVALCARGRGAVEELYLETVVEHDVEEVPR